MRAHPNCPVCQSAITFLEGLAMWNPWRVKCPHCRAELMMSGFMKTLSTLVIPLGVAYGSIPIYMEETGRWVTSDSLLYFAVSAPALLALSYVLWPRTRLV